VTHTIDEGTRQTPITRLSDAAWEQVRPLLEVYDPPRRLGRKRVDGRGVLEAILYRRHSGCRWNHLPKAYPDDSTVHRTYQRWQTLGVLDRMLDVLQAGAAS
jgi:transposase